MTMQERDALREIQDRVIRKIEGMGIAEDAVIVHDPATNAPVRLSDLRELLHPRLIDKFLEFTR